MLLLSKPCSIVGSQHRYERKGLAITNPALLQTPCLPRYIFIAVIQQPVSSKQSTILNTQYVTSKCGITWCMTTWYLWIRKLFEKSKLTPTSTTPPMWRSLFYLVRQEVQGNSFWARASTGQFCPSHGSNSILKLSGGRLHRLWYNTHEAFLQCALCMTCWEESFEQTPLEPLSISS